MKKSIAIILSLAMLLSLSACSDENNKDTDPLSEESLSESSLSEESSAVSSEGSSLSQAESSEVSSSQETEKSSSVPTPPAPIGSQTAPTAEEKDFYDVMCEAFFSIDKQQRDSNWGYYMADSKDGKDTFIVYEKNRDFLDGELEKIKQKYPAFSQQFDSCLVRADCSFSINDKEKAIAAIKTAGANADLTVSALSTGVENADMIQVRCYPKSEEAEEIILNAAESAGYPRENISISFSENNFPANPS